VGAVPAPRVRPLAEVLPGRRDVDAAPPGVDARTWRAQDELDRLAAALRPVAARMLTALADVLAGRRPPAHLDALLTPDALEALVRAAPAPGARAAGARAGAPGAGAALRGLRVCAIGPRAAEVAAVVHGRDRVRALAARLERTDEGSDEPGRWRVVTLRPG
jgi:hypothetical protein